MGGWLLWLQTVYTFLALVPFVAFFAAWGAVLGITKDQKKARTAAIDVTTIFLIGSVSVLTNRLLGSDMGFWIVILIFLVTGGLIGNLQNRLKGKVDPVKIIKALLRLGFVVLSACYVLLLCIGFGKYIITG